METDPDGFENATIVLARPPGHFALLFLGLFLVVTVSILTLSAAFRSSQAHGLANAEASQVALAASAHDLVVGSITWDVVEGEGRLQEGGLFHLGQHALVLANAPTPNYQFQVVMKVEGSAYFVGQAPRLLFRYQSPRDHYAAYLTPEGTLVLGKMAAGEWIEQFVSAHVGGDLRDFHIYRVRAFGDEIRIWFDDEEAIALIDPSAVPAGGVGVATVFGQALVRDLALLHLSNAP